MGKQWCVPMVVIVLLALDASTLADEKADAMAVLDKAIKALGGEAKLKTVKAATWKGKGKFYGLGGEGIDYTGDWAFHGAQKYRVILDVELMGQKFRQTIVVNGDKGWIKNNDMVMPMDKDMLAEQKEQLYANWIGFVNPLVLKEKTFELSPIGEIKIDNRTAVGIRAASKGHRDLNLYFDKETYLPLKCEWRVKDLQGVQGGKEVTQEVFPSDYQDVDGLKIAVKVLVKWDGKKYVEAELSDLKNEEKLDDSVFAEP
jgi:outer membrane lipoprotein-sorting protein